MREGEHILFCGLRGRFFHPFWGLTSMFMHRFSKFEVLNWLELSRKQIGTSKGVLEYIFRLLLMAALVKWVNLS